MGVKNLWKIFSQCAKKPQFENKTLAIDTSIWMHHYKSLPDNMVIFSVSKRIFKILYNKIKPVFIFDGKPSNDKLNTIKIRKENEMKSLIRRIVLNKKCIKCGELLKNCKHINDFDHNEIDKINKEAIDRLKNHNYNWGLLADDDSSYLVNENEKDNSSLDNENLVLTIPKDTDYIDKSIYNFNYETIKDLSKTEQLEKLIDLRSKRKLPMGNDNSNSMAFCSSQIDNIKKRNNITNLIRNLNKNGKKIIQSDWTAYSELKKDETNVYKSFYYNEKEEAIVNNELSESSDLEILFEKHQKDEWTGVYEKHQDKVPKDNNFDIKAQINHNLTILKSNKNVIDRENINIKMKKNKVVEVEEPIKPETRVNNDSESFEYVYDSNDTALEPSNDYSSASESSDYEAKYNFKTDEINIEAEITDNDLKRVQKLIIELLSIFELPYIESIGESDAQCGYLFKNNFIDGVISEDNDMIIHGVTVYKNFFRKDKDIVTVSFNDVVEILGLDQTSLLKISYFLGSDYCLGVKGVGIKTVLKRLDEVSEDEISFLREIYNDKNVKKIDKLNFGILNRNKLKKYLLIKGFDQNKIDELMVYCKAIIESNDK